MPDITDLAHERDSDGELLPVEETVEILGEDYQVDVYPATTGQRNEWVDRFEDEAAELEDDTTDELLDEFLADLSPEDFDADSWADVRPAITDALGNVIMARLFDAEDPDAFAEELETAAAEATQGNP